MISFGACFSGSLCVDTGEPEELILSSISITGNKITNLVGIKMVKKKVHNCDVRSYFFFQNMNKLSTNCDEPVYIANISNVQLIFGPVIREQCSIDCQMMKHLVINVTHHQGRSSLPQFLHQYCRHWNRLH